MSEQRCGDVRALIVNGGGGHPLCVLPVGHEGQHRDALPDAHVFCTLIWSDPEEQG